MPSRRPRRIPVEVGVPIRKPMATARRVSLFEREVTVRLSPVGVDVLFGAGTVLSEGSVEGGRFAGSTMITVDLARTAAAIAEPADAATARRVAALVPTDDHARGRARRIAIAEARRAAGDLVAPAVDLRARAVGTQLQLDLDLEAVRPPR
jgi:hypothetical protein